MNISGLKRAVFRNLDYYQTSVDRWWDTMGPTEYICLLVGTLFVGWVLLKGNAR
jgi:hypothetical protein